MNVARGPNRFIHWSGPRVLICLGLVLAPAVALAQSPDSAAEVPTPRTAQDRGGAVLAELEYDLDPGWWHYHQSCDANKWISYGQKFESRPDFRARCDLQIHDFESVVKPTLSRSMEIIVPDNGTIAVYAAMRVSKEHGQEPVVSVARLSRDGSSDKIGFADLSRVSHETGQPIAFTPPKPAQARQVEKGDRIAITIDASWARASWAHWIPAQGARVRVIFTPAGVGLPTGVPGVGLFAEDQTVTVVLVKGTLTDVTANRTLKAGDVIPPEHVVQTGPGAGAEAILRKRSSPQSPSHTLLAPSSACKFMQGRARSFDVFVILGRVFTLFTDKEFGAETYNSVAGVEGTAFETAYDKESGKTTVAVYEGAVRVQCKSLSGPPVVAVAGMRATIDNACNQSLTPLPASADTPAKAGWTITVSDGTTDPDDTGLTGPEVETPPSSATGRAIHPRADSHVYAYDYSGWSKANWGAYDRLGAGWHSTGGEKRTFLAFDLSGVSPSSVGRATLRLFHYHTGGSNALALGVYRVTSPWVEGRGTYKPATLAAPDEISWVHQPAVDSQRVAQFHPGSEVNRWVEVDVTPLVQAWLSGTPNHGLMIKAEGNLTGATPTAQYGFYSREANPDQRPVLVVSAASGVDQPPPPGTHEPFSLHGEWSLTCVGDILFQFRVTLAQTGTHFSGDMVRTNGNEPRTRVDGRILPDGSLEFMRTTGSWRQHYIGTVSKSSGKQALALEGRFGNQGQETFKWTAHRSNAEEHMP